MGTKSQTSRQGFGQIGEKIMEAPKKRVLNPHSTIVEISVGGNTFNGTESEKIAREFSKFFTTQGVDPPLNYDPATSSRTDSLLAKSAAQIFGPLHPFFSTKAAKHRRRNCRKAQNSPFSESEIDTVMKESKHSFSRGDSFWEPTLNFSHTFKLTRLLFFNICFLMGAIPEKWLTVITSPIYKGKGRAPELMDSYRPISVMSVVAKEYQRLIKKRLHWVLDQESTYPNYVWGFRKGRSSDDMLLYFEETIKAELKKGNQVGAIFLDISKAFDRIDRNSLLLKLKNIKGLNGPLLNALAAFTQPTKTRVKVNGSIDGAECSNFGVRQGDILSPDLWAIFFDIFKLVDADHKFIFADDGAILVIGKKASTIQKKLTTAFKQILDWGAKNRVSFDHEKTFSYLFTSKKNPSELQIKMGDLKNDKGEQIFITDKSFHSTKPAKYIGFRLDRKMSGRAHLSKIVGRFNFKLRIFDKLANKKTGLPSQDLLLIYKNWGLQTINYALPSFLFCPSVSNKISSIQKGWLQKVGGFFKNCAALTQEAFFGVLPAELFLALKNTLKVEKILRYPASHPLRILAVKLLSAPPESLSKNSFFKHIPSWAKILDYYPDFRPLFHPSHLPVSKTPPWAKTKFRNILAPKDAGDVGTSGDRTPTQAARAKHVFWKAIKNEIDRTGSSKKTVLVSTDGSRSKNGATGAGWVLSLVKTTPILSNQEILKHRIPIQKWAPLGSGNLSVF